MGSSTDFPVRGALERDFSWSSTITVEFDAKLETTLLARVYTGITSDKNKCVRINESANVYHDNDHYSKEDCKATWYTPEEHATFKENTMLMIQAIIDFEAVIQEDEEERHEQSYSATLEHMYNECSTNNLNADETLTQAQKAEFASMYQIHYNLVRIGLERYTVQILKQGMKERHQLMIQLTHEFQEEPTTRGSNNYWQSNDLPTDEAFREACESISRPARIFSHHMALARASHR